MSIVNANPSAITKASLLSQGVVPTDAFMQVFGSPFLEKRRAYGNPDDAAYEVKRLPQELYILPDRLICAVNVRHASCWRLDHVDGDYVIYRTDDPSCHTRVTFPIRPQFYESSISDMTPVRALITLYGGRSLGVFVYGRCALDDMGKPCQFCSLAPTRKHQTEFPDTLRANDVKDAIQIALREDTVPISQVMINGGNFPNPDKGFCYYVDVVMAAREAIDASHRDVELHLIVGPPRDLQLVERLSGSRARVAVNLEVGDPEVFARICPGKSDLYGQDHIRHTLIAIREALGLGAANSIFVGGLEPLNTLIDGMQRAADDGITPVINVFHPDPDTSLADAGSPSTDDVLSMGRALQDIYRAHPFMRPFYLECGRNSLDTEAYRGLF